MAVINSREHFSGQANTTIGHETRSGETLNAILVDLTGDVADILVKLQALADKLDLDAGVTDTDYRAVVDATAPDFPRTEIKVI